MRLEIGCSLRFRLPAPTPIVAALSAAARGEAAFETPDQIRAQPRTPLSTYRDTDGNWRVRLTAPAGEFALGAEGVALLGGAADLVDPGARAHAVEELPEATLRYLLASRYCETDLLAEQAWRLFGRTEPGWRRVQAVADYVRRAVAIDPAAGPETAQTAVDTLTMGRGGWRDAAHLAIAFCRCLNVPARYCVGYAADLDAPPPERAARAFPAWIEVFLGDAWRAFDLGGGAPRRARVLVARGRDAADAGPIHIFGPYTLLEAQVWAVARAERRRPPPSGAL